MKPELLEKLNWLADKHVTREYRTTTISEDDARQILAALQASPPSGGEVYQWRDADGLFWKECDQDTYLAAKDKPQFKTRTLYTSPRVVDDELYEAVKYYFNGWLLDEADYRECCTSDDQFKAVKRIQAALGEGK